MGTLIATLPPRTRDQDPMNILETPGPCHGSSYSRSSACSTSAQTTSSNLLVFQRENWDLQRVAFIQILTAEYLFIGSCSICSLIHPSMVYGSNELLIKMPRLETTDF